MSGDAIPPKLPTAFDLLLRPVAAEIRPAPPPRVRFTVGYAGNGYCEPSTPHPEEDDSDPPRMLRLFLATGTSTGTVSRSYDDCSRVAVVTGQPYTVDVRVWDAESCAIIERLNHDYKLQNATRKSTST
jgi:hypothetical protein